MKFEKITKEKALSLSSKIPQVVSKLIISPEDVDIYLGITNSLMPYYVVATVLDNEITWISDKDYQEELNELINKN